MKRMLSLLVLGGLTCGLVLAAPAVGHAQVIVPSPGYYSPGYAVTPYDYSYTPGYGVYPYSPYGSGYYPYSSYNYYRRPTIVHPEYSHWTPGRGWHTHGHLHVPHHGHYHTRGY